MVGDHPPELQFRGVNRGEGCDDGGMPRFPRAILCATVAVAVLAVVAGCSGPNPFQAAANATTTTVAARSTSGSGQTQGTGVGANGFIPDRNLSDCIGTNERPNCGSPKKGGLGMWLTFAALIAGVGFIMWRISIGVRKRDAIVNQPNNDAKY